MAKETYTGADKLTGKTITTATVSTRNGCDCINPIESYLGVFSSELKNREHGPGIMLDLPINNLFGTQVFDGYIPSKNKSVMEKLHKCGIDCLREHPPLGCALFEPIDTGIIAIIDGHHRIRNLGRMQEKPSKTPILLLTVGELSEVLTEANPQLAEKFAPIVLERQIKEDIISTLTSFRRMPESKQSEPIFGVKSMQDLIQQYPPSPKTIL
jgi:hypothetical protein